MPGRRSHSTPVMMAPSTTKLFAVRFQPLVHTRRIPVQLAISGPSLSRSVQNIQIWMAGAPIGIELTPVHIDGYTRAPRGRPITLRDLLDCLHQIGAESGRAHS